MLIHLPAPHIFVRQHPSQNPHIPATSDQTTYESHPPTLPSSLWLLFSVEASASLLCSRWMCTAQWSSFLRKSTPLLHHSRSCVLDLLHVLSRRPLPCLAVDPVHHRLAVDLDVHLDIPCLLPDWREPWDQPLLAPCWVRLRLSSIDAASAVSSASRGGALRVSDCPNLGECIHPFVRHCREISGPTWLHRAIPSHPIQVILPRFLLSAIKKSVFGSMATEGADKKRRWDELHVQDGRSNDQQPTHVHRLARVPNHPQQSGSEPCRGADLTGCTANTEGKV